MWAVTSVFWSILHPVACSSNNYNTDYVIMMFIWRNPVSRVLHIYYIIIYTKRNTVFLILRYYATESKCLYLYVKETDWNGLFHKRNGPDPKITRP